MSAPLHGLTIVVTRPAAQAQPFLELATQAGARCIAFPTLAIERLPVPASVVDEVTGTTWDWAIYTSGNAVDAACDALGGRLPAARRAAAVGRATARALERREIAVALRPETANSEGLLASEELQSVCGASVLLVKGLGGRDLLLETLTSRGAHVRPLHVYRRTRGEPGPQARAELHDALVDEEPRLVVSVTSADVLDALLQLVDDGDAQLLRSRPLLLPGPRVAAAARQLGWRGPIVEAATAEDGAMLRALADFAAPGPGAHA